MVSLLAAAVLPAMIASPEQIKVFEVQYYMPETPHLRTMIVTGVVPFEVEELARGRSNNPDLRDLRDLAKANKSSLDQVATMKFYQG